MLKVRNLRRGAGCEHMAHGCMKVHGGVPIVLYIFFRCPGAKDQLPGH